MSDAFNFLTLREVRSTVHCLLRSLWVVTSKIRGAQALTISRVQISSRCPRPPVCTGGTRFLLIDPIFLSCGQLTNSNLVLQGTLERRNILS
jgi:hypothetical protein